MFAGCKCDARPSDIGIDVLVNEFTRARSGSVISKHFKKNGAQQRVLIHHLTQVVVKEGFALSTVNEGHIGALGIGVVPASPREREDEVLQYARHGVDQDGALVAHGRIHLRLQATGPLVDDDGDKVFEAARNTLTITQHSHSFEV